MLHRLQGQGPRARTHQHCQRPSQQKAHQQRHKPDRNVGPEGTQRSVGLPHDAAVALGNVVRQIRGDTAHHQRGKVQNFGAAQRQHGRAVRKRKGHCSRLSGLTDTRKRFPHSLWAQSRPAVRFGDRGHFLGARRRYLGSRCNGSSISQMTRPPTMAFMLSPSRARGGSSLSRRALPPPRTT